jgi:hypothetical protein
MLEIKKATINYMGLYFHTTGTLFNNKDYSMYSKISKLETAQFQGYPEKIA